jgi:hypothetical protein
VDHTREQVNALSALRAEAGGIREFRTRLQGLVRQAASAGISWSLIAHETGMTVRDVFVIVSSDDPERQLAAAGVVMADVERPLRLVLVRVDDASRASGTGVAATGHLDPVTGYASLSWRGSRSRFVNVPVGEWRAMPTVENVTAVEWLESIHGHGGSSRLLVIDDPLDDTARELVGLLGAENVADAHARDVGVRRK